MASLHREDQWNPCAGWLWFCASVPLSSSRRSSSTLPASSGHSGFEDEDAEHQDPLSHPLNYFLPACRSRSFWRTRVRKREFKKKRRWSRSWASWRKVRGRFQRDLVSGPSDRAASRWEAVEVHRLFLLCHHRYHYNWQVYNVVAWLHGIVWFLQ